MFSALKPVGTLVVRNVFLRSYLPLLYFLLISVSVVGCMLLSIWWWVPLWIGVGLMGPALCLQQTQQLSPAEPTSYWYGFEAAFRDNPLQLQLYLVVLCITGYFYLAIALDPLWNIVIVGTVLLFGFIVHMTALEIVQTQKKYEGLIARGIW